MIPKELSNRVFWAGLGAIALASFAICVAFDLFYFGDSVVSADEIRFLESAAGLLAHGHLRVGHDVAWEMPGAPLLFAAITSLQLGPPLTVIRIVNAALVAAQSVLLGLLAARLFGDRLAGMIAAAIVGFYPYIVFTQGMALGETPFMVLIVAGFLALYVWRDRGAQVDWSMALAVAVLTAATYTKAALTIMPPVLVGLAAVGRQPLSRIVRIFVVAAAIYCALLAPWWARNYALLGAFVPFGTSSTINLYTGNSPQNPNALIYGPNMPDDWDLDRGVSLLAIPGELERYRAFRDAAFRYIAEDPAAFFRRAWIKLKVFWSIVPNALDFQNPIYRIVGAISFGPVLALAILCVLLLRRRFADLLPIYVTIGYFTALYAITIASIRYRLPIEPLLIALASWPLTLAVRAVLGARETKTAPRG